MLNDIVDYYKTVIATVNYPFIWSKGIWKSNTRAKLHNIFKKNRTMCRKSKIIASAIILRTHNGEATRTKGWVLVMV